MAKKREKKRRSRAKQAPGHRVEQAVEPAPIAERAEKPAAPSSSPEQRPAPRLRASLTGLLGAVLLLGLLSMPARVYRGDANAARMATSQLILHGSFGIPYDQPEGVPEGFVRNRGQYFYENDARGRYYSKYGVLQSLLYLPAMWAAHLDHGDLKIGQRPREVVFWLNVNNLAVSLLVAVYLLLLAGRFTRRPLVALGLVLCCLYASFVWYYLRAQSTEIFQLWFFLGMGYHLFRWVDGDRGSPRGWGQLGACALYGALLTLTKPYYGLVFPLAWLGMQFSSRDGFDLRSAARDALYLGAPALLAAGLVLLQNRLTFGAFFDFGYFQAEGGGGFKGNRFAAELIPSGLYQLLLLPSRSAFLYFPWLIPAAFGVGRFWRSHRLELLFASLCFVVFLLFVSAQQEPHGGWCLGPRYLLFVLPLLGLMALPALDWIVDNRQQVRGGVALCLLATVVAAQVWLNTRVNQLEFHADWHVRAFLGRLQIEEAQAYFDRRHAGLVFGDLAAFRRGEAPFAPFEMARNARPDLAPLIDARERHFRSHWILKRNYYWFGQ